MRAASPAADGRADRRSTASASSSAIPPTAALSAPARYRRRTPRRCNRSISRRTRRSATPRTRGSCSSRCVRRARARAHTYAWLRDLERSRTMRRDSNRPHTRTRRTSPDRLSQLRERNATGANRPPPLAARRQTARGCGCSAVRSRVSRVSRASRASSRAPPARRRAQLARGQSIKLTCIAVLGVCKEHAKWSPTAKCTYRFNHVVEINHDLLDTATEEEKQAIER